jgi:hypothetical protein
MGVVTLTTRHAAAYYWVRYGNRRTYLRAGLLLALGVAVFVLAYGYFGRIALDITLVIWFVIPNGAFLRGVEGLMRRVPNNQLAAFARSAFVGLIGYALLTVVVAVLGHFAWTDADWQDSHLAFSAISATAGISLGVAVYVLVIRVRRNLTTILR